MNGMKRNSTQGRGFGRIIVACALLSLCLWSSVSAAVSLTNQGYLFMHPFFASRSWKASLPRLDVVMPDDSLAKYQPQGFDVSLGTVNAVAVFTTNGGALFCMPVLRENLNSQCLGNALTFDPPRLVAPGKLVLGNPRTIYVVKDSLYAYDSLRIVVPSPATPLKFYIARINLSSSSVTKLDSITLTQSWNGQRILGIAGDPDPVTKQDRGIWVTGAQGLIRHIPYTSHQWGAAVKRDLADKPTVLSTNGVYAGTDEGRLYKWNSGSSTFNLELQSAGKPVRRVYQQGAIGDNGLFKENAGGVWKNNMTFGVASYRYANFVRRPGGFGVELLDSTWKYTVHTYRDTSSVVESTVPSYLRDSIGKTPFMYNGSGTLNLTVNLNDPDSNYSDYRLFMNGYFDLKSDGVNTVNYASMPDSENCHIGALKMTSGRVRLVLTPDSLKIMHDCAIGALNATCNSCYWKPYTFAKSSRWSWGSSVTLTTTTQTLRIAYGSVLTGTAMPPGKTAGSILRARLNGSGMVLEFPLKTGVRATGFVMHDLKGRLLASLPIHNQLMVALPALRPLAGIIIVTCKLSDGSSIRQKVPVVR